MSELVYRGRVVFLRWTNDQTQFHGFIAPNDSDGSRESNIYFPSTIVDGPMPVLGDAVEFTRFRNRSPTRGTYNAMKVWKAGEHRHVA